MRFNVSSKELLKVLKITGAVMQKNCSLPILADHLFTRKGDLFLITGSSSENSLTMPVGITLDSESDFQEFCLPAKDVIGLLGSLAEQPVTFDIDLEANIAKIIYQSGQVSVPIDSSVEFPRINGVDTSNTEFEVDSNIFFPAMAAACKCTAPDNTLRPQLSAVALDVKDEGVVFVGTDGHSLYKYAYMPGAPFLKGSKNVILIPNTIVGALAAPFAGVEKITVMHDGKHVCLKSGDITFVIRDIEQRYVNYDSVIPKECPYHAILPVSALAGAVRRVQIMATESSNMVKLSKEGMFLTLSAEDTDFSKKASENLVLADVDNPLTLRDDFAIGFKASSLAMLLGNISTDNVRLELTESSKPILVKEDAPNSVLTELLMPMQLN